MLKYLSFLLVYNLDKKFKFIEMYNRNNIFSNENQLTESHFIYLA